MDAGNQIPSVIAAGAPSSYNVAPRVDSEPGRLHMISEKKKRGRPRKYKPDESSNNRVLSAMQISSSASRKSYTEKTAAISRLVNSERKQKSKIGSENLDNWLDCSTGSSFLPHVMTINAGEDISAKIMEFSQQGPRSVCVVSGTGSVLNVTLRLPNSSGSIITYEGLFEILSFTGSFNPLDLQCSKLNQPGTMTITLSGADGCVIGGSIAGRTTAATTVKVVVTSFLLTGPGELKSKKQCTSGTCVAPNDSNAHSSKNYPEPESPNEWPSSREKLRQQSSSDINISLQG